MTSSWVMWDERYAGYDFGLGHPMHPSRLQLTHRLAQDLGLLDHDDVVVRPARHASDDELLTVHTPDLIEAVRQASADPASATGRHGVGTEDTPAFARMHEASTLAVGATLEACRAVWSGEVDRACNIAGGLHHAMPQAASGFCVYNDIAVGIQHLLDSGAKRVLYLDLDVHHGDGVERCFWNDPRVMTISLHETGRALFPGTGFPGDTGGPRAPDTAVNIALPPGTGDEGWLRAYQAVVPTIARAFAPEIVVSQHGCDCHYADPLAHLSVSMEALAVAYGWVRDLAEDLADGRWVSLGGGGYELVEVVPRAWAHLIGVVTGRPVDPTTAVPDPWRRHVEDVYGQDAPRRMGDREGREIRFGRWEEGHDPDDAVDAAIMATRRAAFPGWGLDPYLD
ncbi:MAG: acetoin utilization protein AcuC [Arsenicicoccus sp.]|uniref:acetoin utilization protein AcuC n=1 Tax=Serinicoccus profundi TaxID=1078471 RepID=UPI000255EC6C|nr:acetoin utilization protein AcuC [Serinicoccus profundi]PZU50051.1 MAG: acetoin utilization protein AcuC [Arsenicicoccus sp.]